MKVLIEERFYRDLKRVRSRRVRERAIRLVRQVEGAASLWEIPEVAKLRGYTNAFRIRVGDYRVGIVLEGDTVIFVRFLHRRDIYRYFP